MKTYACIVILAGALFAAATQAQADLNEGLVGYWKFDEGGGITAIDSSGNGNNGTLVNGPVWTAGKIGGALSLDGSDDYINVGSAANLDNLGPLTYSAWINLRSLDKRSIIFSKGDYYTRDGNIRFYMNTISSERNNLTFNAPFILGSVLKTSIPNTPSVTSWITAGTWTHVAVTWDGGNSSSGVTLYVNGSPIIADRVQGTQYTTKADNSAYNQILGGLLAQDAVNTSFNGSMDDLRVYNRVLSATEIQELYALGFGGNPPPPPADTFPPLRSRGEPIGQLPMDTTTATLSIQTNEPATCKYSLSQNPAVDLERTRGLDPEITVFNVMPFTFINTGGTTHTTPVSGLVNGKNNFYYVRCQDTARNTNENDYIIKFNVASVLPSAPPAPASGTAYFVATNGNDANPGTPDAPFKTIKKGAGLIRPGDILYLRGGIYDEPILSGTIPNGTSWDLPVTLKAYPGEKPILRPSKDYATDVIRFGGSSQYIVIDGLILDGSAMESGGTVTKVTDNAHHIRYKNCELATTSKGHGLLISYNDDPSYVEMDNCDVYNVGLDGHLFITNPLHAVYLHSSHNTFENSRFFNNCVWSFHFYDGDPSDNIIRNNIMRGNQQGGAVIIVEGHRNLIANNLIYDMPGFQIGLQGADDTKVFNNTIIESGGGIFITNSYPNLPSNRTKVINNIVYNANKAHWGGVVHVEAGHADTEIRNNLLVGRSDGRYILYDAGTNTVSSGNILGLVGDPNVNPQFANLANRDLQLQASSPAVDAGIAIPEVTSDFSGAARPQGAAYDIGAYEYVSLEADLSGNGSVTAYDAALALAQGRGALEAAHIAQQAVS